MLKYLLPLLLVSSHAAEPADSIVLSVHLGAMVCTQGDEGISCQNDPPVINDVTFNLDHCSEGRCQGRWDNTVQVLDHSFSAYVVVSELNSEYSIVAGTSVVPTLEMQLGAGGSLTNSTQIQGAEVVINNADGSTTYITPYLDISPAGTPSGIK